MKRKLTVILIIAAVLLIGLIWLLWGNSALVTTVYEVPASAALPASFDGFRIAQVSDLHNAVFGDDNSKLLDMLAEAEPDIIAITGDLIDSRHTDIDIAVSFVEAASEIAPVYYVTGNHESRLDLT